MMTVIIMPATTAAMVTRIVLLFLGTDCLLFISPDSIKRDEHALIVFNKNYITKTMPLKKSLSDDYWGNLYLFTLISFEMIILNNISVRNG